MSWKPDSFKSAVASAIAILACAVPATLVSWSVVDTLGWPGVVTALATLFLAMLLGTLFFAGLVALGKVVRTIR